MSTNTSTAVRDYLARVRTALADLPAAEIDEILEDVRPHLTEIADELGDRAKVEAMVERLGTPESYAAELRASGGYPAPPTAESTAGATPRFAARLALWSMLTCAFGTLLTGFGVALELQDDILLALVLIIPVLLLSAWHVWGKGWANVSALPEVRKAKSAFAAWQEKNDTPLVKYARSLQPSWRIFAALTLVGVAVLMVLMNKRGILAAAGLVALAAILVWVTPKSHTDRRWLWAALPISALALGSAFGLLGYVVNTIDDRNAHSNYYSYSNVTRDGQPQLNYGNESVENIYAFDSSGKPLTDIYLYDAEGRPLTLPRYACEEGTSGKSKVGADNRFPRPKIEQDVADNRGNLNGYNGYRSVCTTTEGVPFTAAIPQAPTTPATPPPAPSSIPPALPPVGEPGQPTG